MRRNRRWLLAGLLPAALARAQDAGEPAGERLAWTVVPDVVRITEAVKPGRTSEQGFGLVVGERAGELYIATADHVVRGDDGMPNGTVQVTFEREQGTPREATLLELRLPPRHGDLAVLEIARPPGYEPQWPAAADIGEMALGTRAWRIGKQERWTPSVNPGAYVGTADAIWLAFDDLDTPRGSSGGPVVTADGVVGLVIADGGSTGDPDRVLPTDIVARQLRVWDIPWNLRRPAPTSGVAIAPLPPAAGPSASSQTSPADPSLTQPNPADSALAQPTLAQTAQTFLTRYYASLSDSGDVVLARLPGEIADPIDFFGKRMARSAYLGIQEKYFRRWPQRRFVLRTEQDAVRCDPAISTCRITGTVDYDVQDRAAGRASAGSEAVFVRLHREGDRFVIDEQGPAPR